MPEAAMHEQRYLAAGKDQVGRSGEVRAMKPEAQAKRVRPAAHCKLWLGVDLAYPAHMCAALKACEMIGQGHLQLSNSHLS
jgi:hypothetical protein